MTIAAAQYDKFKEQIVTGERVFAFTDARDLLVYPIEGSETVPFWSSCERLETIQQRLPKYRKWEITEMSFTDFWRRLDKLEREKIQVGTNWSGARLLGYNVPIAELRVGLLYWIDKLGKRHLLDAAV
jgi:hypothetical protein